jgi:peptidoglycan/LPS O-acetylase OafA/YrhL
VEEDTGIAAAVARRAAVGPAGIARAFAPGRTLRQLLVPPRSNFLPVDGLRALSVLWVMLWHALWYRVPWSLPGEGPAIIDGAPRLIVAGHYGVDVFFVISGFLIGLILMREREARGAIDVKRFYARRFVRLMPAYAVALGLYCLGRGANCDTVWANLLYVNNFLPVTRQAMFWAWSLAIEEQFYLVFPAFLLLVYYRLRRGRLALLVGLLAAAVLIRWWIAVHWDIRAPLPLTEDLARLGVFTDHLYTKPYTRYGALLCGVIAAAAYLGGWARPFFARRRAAAAAGLVVALASIGAVAMAPLDVPTARWPALASDAFLAVDHYALAAGVAYLLLYSLFPAGGLGALVNRILSARTWYPVAQLSYSAYLLHPMVLDRFYGAAAHLGWLGAPVPVLYAAGLALSLLAAAAVYLLVEKPLLNLRDAPVASAAAGSSAAAA